MLAGENSAAWRKLVEQDSEPHNAVTGAGLLSNKEQHTALGIIEQSEGRTKSREIKLKMIPLTSVNH